MSLKVRHDNYFNIKKLFKIKEDYCSTYFDKKIKNKLESYDLSKIGEGAKGKIYKIYDKKISIAIKVMFVNDFGLKWSLTSPRWREVKLLLDFTKDVKSNKIRNLPLSFGYHICKGKDANAIVLYYEYFDNILKEWLFKTRSEEEWISFILQCLVTIKFLRERYALTHNDLTWVNIMYNKIESGGYWKYITNDFDLFVPNEGYEFIFWDFGSSKSYQFPPRKFEHEVLEKTFNTRRDQKYILDICKRIKMNQIINRYTYEELAELFKTKDDIKYKEIVIEEETKNFDKYEDKSRLSYVLSKNLAFYLVETNKYEKLKKDRKENIYNLEDEIPLPPKEVEALLQKIVDNDFESDIDIILKKYFPEYIDKDYKVNKQDIYNMKSK